MAEKKTASRNNSGYTGKTKSSASKSRSKKAAELERQRAEALKKSQRRRQTASVILLALGVMLTLLAIIPGSEGWRSLYDVMHGLFGFAAYVLGPLMIYAAVIISAKQPKSTITATVLKFVFFLLLICAAVEIFAVGKVNGENFGEVVKNLYTNGRDFKGGGFFAIILGVPLLFLGRLGASIIIIIMALGSILLMIDMPINELFEKIGGFARDVGESAAEKREKMREESALANEEYEERARLKKEQKLLKEQQKVQQKIEQRMAAEAERQRRLADMQEAVNSIGSTAPEPVSANKPQAEMPEILTVTKTKTEKKPVREPDIKPMEPPGQSPDFQPALKQYMEKRHPIMRDDTVRPEDSDRYEDNDIELVPIIDALDKLNAEKGPARVSKIVDAPRENITSSDDIIDNITDISDTDEAELPFDLDDIITENRAFNSSGFIEPPAPHSEPAEEIVPLSRAAFERSENGSNTGLSPNLSEVYSLPPMSLLNEVKKSAPPADIASEIRKNADKLVEVLASFKVKTTYLGATRGPSVTRYELEPAQGVRLNKITALADDIAMQLAANSVSIAPVPGKSAVGVEIPNTIKDNVSFRELVDTPEFKKTFDRKLDAVLGKDISGNTVRCDIAKMPHLLIAGTTGSGKSVCVNSIIMSILMKSTPSDVRLIMVDPKQVEFMMYNGIPHLLIPVVTDPKKAAGALAWAVTEMERRLTLFSENSVKNIDGFNQLCEDNEELEKVPYIVVFIDELADLMMSSSKDVEDNIVRIAQKARAAGIHLVIATQKPIVKVVTGLIKGNIPSRIALMVASQIDSQVILDEAGAEKLLGNGDMLYKPVGMSKPVRLQGCYVADGPGGELERVVTFIKQTFTAQYDEDIIADIERQTELANSGDSASSADAALTNIRQDEKLEEAIEFVIDSGQASTSALQRHLGLGFGRAGRLIDTMEKMGVVGPYAGSKPREVLITKSEWYEIKLRK